MRIFEAQARWIVPGSPEHLILDVINKGFKDGLFSALARDPRVEQLYVSNSIRRGYEQELKIYELSLMQLVDSNYFGTLSDALFQKRKNKLDKEWKFDHARFTCGLAFERLSNNNLCSPAPEDAKLSARGLHTLYELNKGNKVKAEI